jgi:microcystin-dependent protein
MGQISTYSFNFAPKYWAGCNGQLLPIAQNLALFSLLGTQFGGNGSTQFALPDLQGRVPLHAGSGPPAQGLAGGAPTHTLSVGELPAHSHAANAVGFTGVTADPSPTSRLGVSRPVPVYGAASNLVGMAPQVIGVTGDSHPHENRQPYSVINFCICLAGLFPSRN